ncbi:MAG: hypothetical protein K940chlam8_01123 [Chlamydiae bacterium]|nr:hypothetical protein [Chlamydiota bacterium]
MLAYVLIFLSLVSCTSKTSLSELKKQHEKKETILRKSHDKSIFVSQLKQTPAPTYAWSTQFSKITQAHFECKGSFLNPSKKLDNGETLFDCNGKRSHSLPVINDEEWIAPILLTLLNTIQETTERDVIITSGHRCPQHHRYCTNNTDLYNKHQIGAKVAFYVKGYEYQPQKILDLIFAFYEKKFMRYQKETNVSTLPWYNEEIYIKLYNQDEGRNEDNQHPYPYISIQVRKDLATNKNISYDYKTAYKSLKHF